MKNILKKTLCVLLSMMLGLASLAIVSFAADGDLELFVATDTHYIKRSQLGSVSDAEVTVPQSELYFYADYMGKLFFEAEAIIRSLLSEFEASSSQVLLISGDMTNNGDIASHEDLAAIFKEFEVRTGKSILVIPGNHDIHSGTGYCSIEDFKRIYADFGYNEALARHDESGSYTIDLNSKYRLLALDSNDYEKVAGNISESLLKWAGEQVERANADGKHLVGTMHHSLLNHFAIQSTFTGGFDSYSLDSLSKTFANWGIKYMLTGHLHVTDITMATTAEGNKIYDIATGSLISGSNNYRILKFTDESVDVVTKSIERIDTAYLSEGYTAAQLEKITTDFPAYSREYCSDGLYYWIDYFLTVKKFGDSIGLKEGTAAYDAVEKLLSYVREAVKLPLYDRAGTPELDSIAEVAALAGYTLPESDYESAIDIAAVFVLGFFGGYGSIKADSIETVVILEAIRGCVAYAIGKIIDDGEYSQGLALAFKLMGVPTADIESGKVFTNELAKVTYMRTAAGVIVTTAITPLLESISFDAYAPDDLNVTLEPYGAKTKPSLDGDGGQPLTFFQKLIAALRYIFKLLFSGLGQIK